MRCTQCDRHIYRHEAFSCDDDQCKETLCWGCLQKVNLTICCEKMICQTCHDDEYAVCMGCSAEICQNCQVMCTGCQIPICNGCVLLTMITCCQCGEVFCDTCLPQYYETDVCEDCTKVKK